MERVVLEGWLNKRVSGNIFKKNNQRWFKIIELMSLDSFELALAYYQSRLEKSAKSWIYLREITEICDDHKYITVVSTTRNLCIEASTRDEHNTWLNHLGYLCPSAKKNFKPEPPESLAKFAQTGSDAKEDRPQVQNDSKGSQGFATLSSQSLEHHINQSQPSDKRLDRTASVFSRYAGDNNNNSFYQSREQEFYEEEVTNNGYRAGKPQPPTSQPPQRQNVRNEERYSNDRNYPRHDERDRRDPPSRGPPSREPPSRQPPGRAPRRDDYYDDIPHVNSSYSTPRSYSRDSEDRRPPAGEYDRGYNKDRSRDKDRQPYDDRGRNYGSRNYDSRDRSYNSQDRGYEDRSRPYNDRSYDERDRYHDERDRYHDERDRYHDERDRYHDDRDRYHDDRDRYHDDRDRYHDDRDRYYDDAPKSHQNSARSQQDSARSYPDSNPPVHTPKDGHRSQQDSARSVLEKEFDTYDDVKPEEANPSEDSLIPESQVCKPDVQLQNPPTNSSRDSNEEEDIEYTTLDAITKTQRRNQRSHRRFSTASDDSSDEDLPPSSMSQTEAPKHVQQNTTVPPVNISPTPRRAKDLLDEDEDEDTDRKAESAPKKSLNDFLRKDNFQSDSKESTNKNDSSDDEDFDIKAEVRKYSSQNSMSRPPKSRPTAHSPLMQNSSGYNSAINHVRSGTPPRAGAHPGSQVDAGFVSENWDEDEDLVSVPKSLTKPDQAAGNPGVSADPNWLDENFDD